jgi:pimeloyl-ACP methyl ester carboxylesterase
MTDRAAAGETPGVLAAGPASVAPAEADRQVVLGDGRRLAYNVYGDPGGRPILYLHGFPGSRLEAGLTNAAAYRLGLRVVAPDRPGMGRSDPLAGRRITDWPADVAQLADALGWERFAILGVSGGSPYALACAAGLGERVSRLAVVAGMGPPDAPQGTRDMRWFGRLELWLARFWPAAAAILFRWAVRATLADPQSAPGWVDGRLPEADRQTLMRPEIARLFRDSVRESVRQGVADHLAEMRLLGQPWGFRLDGIATPVRLWHGEADITVPVTMGRYVASRLSRCWATYYPGEGHFSLPVNHARVILGDLKELGQ